MGHDSFEKNQFLCNKKNHFLPKNQLMTLGSQNRPSTTFYDSFVVVSSNHYSCSFAFSTYSLRHSQSSKPQLSTPQFDKAAANCGVTERFFHSFRGNSVSHRLWLQSQKLNLILLLFCNLFITNECLNILGKSANGICNLKVTSWEFQPPVTLARTRVKTPS